MDSERLELLALTLVPELGLQRLRRLLKDVGSPREVFRLSRPQMKSLGLTREIQTYILGGWALKDADRTLKETESKGIGLLTLLDREYPPRLKEIYDPPAVLYVKGHLDVLSEPCVAVVGTRHNSVYGGEVAFTLARDLARQGLVVVSGMAIGIDSKAHQGALAAPGRTVAVLGTGVDVAYPGSNRKLYQHIQEKGCVISEFPLGAVPAPQNFPIRNRIISGLSLGTVIPEASEFSGSLITARLTLEQNRELWAVPGNITNPGSYGPNFLIKQGASPVMSFQDILEALPVEILRNLQSQLKKEDAEETGQILPADEREAAVLRQLFPDQAVHFDRILMETGFNITDLSAILVTLEARGLVRAYPGRRYSRRLISIDRKTMVPK